MANGPAILDSQSATVRSVGPEGQVITTGKLALLALPPQAKLSIDGQPAGSAADFREKLLPAGPHELVISAKDYQSRRETVTVPAGGTLNLGLVELAPIPQKRDSWWPPIGNLAPYWYWSIALAVTLGGSLAGTVKLMLRRRKVEQVEPETTAQAPDLSAMQQIGVVLSERLTIPSGTHRDKPRLRLFPIGHNDIGPFDLLFENRLAVGRSPESEICIANDGQVSASHCALSPKGKFILVEDVGSRNGTRVNGVPIKGFLHAEPDSVLGVGRTELRMKLLPVGAR
jgi:hypothetical protein